MQSLGLAVSLGLLLCLGFNLILVPALLARRQTAAAAEFTSAN
jgi:predicted RND superfamily exporter protein